MEVILQSWIGGFLKKQPILRGAQESAAINGEIPIGEYAPDGTRFPGLAELKTRRYLGLSLFFKKGMLRPIKVGVFLLKNFKT